MNAYRCDRCGTYRDGPEDYCIIVNTPMEDEAIVLDLCPECAPVVISPLAAIADVTFDESNGEPVGCDGPPTTPFPSLENLIDEGARVRQDFMKDQESLRY